MKFERRGRYESVIFRFSKDLHGIYDLSIDAEEVADFVNKRIVRVKPRKILFVGGFGVVKELARKAMI